jgi:hypothetical protein
MWNTSTTLVYAEVLDLLKENINNIKNKAVLADASNEAGLKVVVPFQSGP